MLRKNLNIKVDKIQQILLCNTNRDIDNYIKSTNLRYTTTNTRKPNYVIDKKGKVTLLNNEDVTQNYLKGYHLDKSIIVICLENRGWLKRRSKDGKYVDWLGDIYDKRPLEKKWRGMYYWDPYSNKQMEKTSKIVKKLCEQYLLPVNFIGHNTLVSGIEKFKGITTKSNYNEFWRDLNPSFNFEIL